MRKWRMAGVSALVLWLGGAASAGALVPAAAAVAFAAAGSVLLFWFR